MVAFARANTYFEKANCKLLGLSIDSNPSHLAWVYDIFLKTGITIPFPIIADRKAMTTALMTPAEMASELKDLFTPENMEDNSNG